MRKIIVTTLFASAILFMISSCSSKQTPVNQLEDFATELQENGENYSGDDWEKAIADYSKIEEDLQQYDYTDEELKEIGKLKAKCFKAFAKSSAKILKSQMHNIKMQLDGASEEMESSMDELKGAFDEITNELSE